MKHKLLAIVEKLKNLKELKKLKAFKRLKTLASNLRSMKLFEKLKDMKGFRLQFAHVLMAGVVVVIGFGVYLGYRIIVPYHPQPVAAAINQGFDDFQAVNPDQNQQSLLSQTKAQTLLVKPEHSVHSDLNAKIASNNQTSESKPLKVIKPINKQQQNIDKLHQADTLAIDKAAKLDDGIHQHTVNDLAQQALMQNGKTNKSTVTDSKQIDRATQSTIAVDHSKWINLESEKAQYQASDMEPTDVLSEQSNRQTTAHLKTLNAKMSMLEQQVKSLSEAQTALIALLKKQQIAEQKQLVQQRQTTSNDSIVNGNDITAQKVQQMYDMLHALTMKNTLIKNPLSLVAVVGKYAWLQNNKGVTQSITLGNTIDGYGEVLKIDDQKNEVLMSSGYIFK